MLKPVTKPIYKNGRIIGPPETNRLKAGYFVLKPKESVPPHQTVDREELILVLKGQAEVKIANKTYSLKEKQLLYIPPNQTHLVSNNADIDLEYIYCVALL